MTDLTHPGAPRWGALRKLPWIVAVVLLLLPAVAMQLGVEGVVWTASDFVAMGVILVIACGSFELIARNAPNFPYLVAAAIGVGTGFVLVWANLAVGIIGDGIGAANAMFFGVVGVAIVGAFLARGRAEAMARAMGAAAVALVIAIVVGLATFGATAHEAILTTVFVLGWAASAGLFLWSARG